MTGLDYGVLAMLSTGYGLQRTSRYLGKGAAKTVAFPFKLGASAVSYVYHQSKEPETRRKIWRGATFPIRAPAHYFAKTMEKSLNVVTPSNESIRKYSGWHSAGLITAAGALIGTAAAFDPIQEAVLYQAPFSEAGLAAGIVAGSTATVLAIYNIFRKNPNKTPE